MPPRKSKVKKKNKIWFLCKIVFNFFFLLTKTYLAICNTLKSLFRFFIYFTGILSRRERKNLL